VLAQDPLLLLLPTEAAALEVEALFLFERYQKKKKKGITKMDHSLL
jgi:hypothetical protein